MGSRTESLTKTCVSLLASIALAITLVPVAGLEAISGNVASAHAEEAASQNEGDGGIDAGGDGVAGGPMEDDATESGADGTALASNDAQRPTIISETVELNDIKGSSAPVSTGDTFRIGGADDKGLGNVQDDNSADNASSVDGAVQDDASWGIEAAKAGEAVEVDGLRYRLRDCEGGDEFDFVGWSDGALSDDPAQMSPTFNDGTLTIPSSFVMGGNQASEVTQAADAREMRVIGVNVDASCVTDKVVSLVIPASVDDAERVNFDSLNAAFPALEHLSVDPGNCGLSATHDILYAKSQIGEDESGQPQYETDRDLLWVPAGMRGTTTLPATLRSVPAGAFSKCNLLQAIDVEGESDAYVAHGGMLYARQSGSVRLTLVAAPAGIGPTVTISVLCSTIAERAFAGCNEIETIVVMGDVVDIAEDAFDEGVKPKTKIVVAESGAIESDEKVIDEELELTSSAVYDGRDSAWSDCGLVNIERCVAQGAGERFRSVGSSVNLMSTQQARNSDENCLTTLRMAYGVGDSSSAFEQLRFWQSESYGELPTDWESSGFVSNVSALPIYRDCDFLASEYKISANGKRLALKISCCLDPYESDSFNRNAWVVIDKSTLLIEDYYLDGWSAEENCDLNAELLPSGSYCVKSRMQISCILRPYFKMGLCSSLTNVPFHGDVYEDETLPENWDYPFSSHGIETLHWSDVVFTNDEDHTQAVGVCDYRVSEDRQALAIKYRNLHSTLGPYWIVLRPSYDSSYASAIGKKRFVGWCVLGRGTSCGMGDRAGEFDLLEPGRYFASSEQTMSAPMGYFYGFYSRGFDLDLGAVGSTDAKFSYAVYNGDPLDPHYMESHSVSLSGATIDERYSWEKVIDYQVSDDGKRLAVRYLDEEEVVRWVVYGECLDSVPRGYVFLGWSFTSDGSDLISPGEHQLTGASKIYGVYLEQIEITLKGMGLDQAAFSYEIGGEDGQLPSDWESCDLRSGVAENAARYDFSAIGYRVSSDGKRIAIRYGSDAYSDVCNRWVIYGQCEDRLNPSYGYAFLGWSLTNNDNDLIAPGSYVVASAMTIYGLYAPLCSLSLSASYSGYWHYPTDLFGMWRSEANDVLPADWETLELSDDQTDWSYAAAYGSATEYRISGDGLRLAIKFDGCHNSLLDGRWVVVGQKPEGSSDAANLRDQYDFIGWGLECHPDCDLLESGRHVLTATDTTIYGIFLKKFEMHQIPNIYKTPFSFWQSSLGENIPSDWENCNLYGAVAAWDVPIEEYHSGVLDRSIEVSEYRISSDGTRLAVRVCSANGICSGDKWFVYGQCTDLNHTADIAGLALVGWSLSCSVDDLLVAGRYFASSSSDIVSIYGMYGQPGVTLTLDYNDDGITASTTVTVKPGEAYGDILPTPSWSGARFLGWGTTATASSYATSESIVPDGDHTLYAVWSVNYLRRSFLQQLDGSYSTGPDRSSGIDGIKGAVVTVDPPENIAGFTTPSSQSYTIAKGGRVDFYYMRNSYTFTLVAGDGIDSVTSLSKAQYKYGESVAIDATPISGYTWSTWTVTLGTGYATPTWESGKGVSDKSQTITMPAGNVKLTASATLNSYTITIYHKGENVDDANYGVDLGTTTVTVQHGGSVTPSIITETSSPRRSAGFNDALTQTLTNVIENKTITYEYPRKTYVITVNHKGENVNDSNYGVPLADATTETVKHGASVTPAILPASDSRRIGFNDASTQTLTNVTEAQSVTYDYPRATYSLTLRTSSACETSKTPDKEAYKYQEPVTIEATIKNPAGYTWRSWGVISGSTAPVWEDGKGYDAQCQTITMPAGNVELTPIASKKTFTITVRHMGENANDDGYTLIKTTTLENQSYGSSVKPPTLSDSDRPEGFRDAEAQTITVTGPQTIEYQYKRKGCLVHVTHLGEKLGSSDVYDVSLKNGADIYNVKYGSTLTPSLLSADARAGFLDAETKTLTNITEEVTYIDYQYPRATYTLSLGKDAGVSSVTKDPSKSSYKYQEAVEINAVTRSGYTWSRWSAGTTNGVIAPVWASGETTQSQTITMPAGNVSLTATTTANSYTVAFDYGGATATGDTTKTVTFGSAYGTLPSAPTKPGYNFAGWKINGTGSAITASTMVSVARDHTLKATWTGRPYKLRFNGNGANSGSAKTLPSSGYYTYGSSAALAQKDTFSKTGYDFKGWAHAANATTAAYPVKSDGTIDPITTLASNVPTSDNKIIDLYAVWKAKTYTVTLAPNGGSVSPISTTVTYNARYGTLPIPTRTGYIFEGWHVGSVSGTKVTSTSIVTTASDHTLVAKWTPNSGTKYTVEYYLQNVSGSGYTKNGDATEVESGSTGASVSVEIKSFPGFTHVDTTNSVESGTIKADGSLVLKVYYARNSYSITFDSDGGSAVSTINAKYGASITAPAAPSKSGYDFVHWYVSDGSADTAYTIPTTMPLYGKSLKAKWSPKSGTEYHVAYHLEELTVGQWPSVDEVKGDSTGTYWVKRTGTTGAKATYAQKTFEGFTFDATKTGNVSNATIAADGSTVVSLYYKRNTYALTYVSNPAELSSKISGWPEDQAAIRYEATVSWPGNVSVDGYEFKSWTANASFELNNGWFKMPAKDVKFEASFEAKGVALKANCTFEGTKKQAQTQEMAGSFKVDGTYEVNAPAFEGYAPKEAKKTITVTTDSVQDGTMTIDFAYTPIEYTVTLNNLTSSDPATSSFTITYDVKWSDIDEASLPKRQKYAFDGYFTEAAGAGTQYFDANGACLVDNSDGSLNGWLSGSTPTLFARWVPVMRGSVPLCTDFTIKTDSDGLNASADPVTKAISCETEWPIKVVSVETEGCQSQIFGDDVSVLKQVMLELTPEGAGNTEGTEGEGNAADGEEPGGIDIPLHEGTASADKLQLFVIPAQDVLGVGYGMVIPPELRVNKPDSDVLENIGTGGSGQAVKIKNPFSKVKYTFSLTDPILD